MRKILYIGNNLKTKNANISSIQALGGFLEQEGFKMYYSSSQLNKIARMIDMIITLMKYKNKVDYVIIDTYSTRNF
ncbi:MAG: glycosyltransferase family 1 protein, partial [Bacteroidia bacterium]|nr:glycosyltransferase family 1 protein [Bacteroidia bacterium]